MLFPRDAEARIKHAEAVLHTNIWDPNHLKIIDQRLSASMKQNMNGFERTYGEGTYTRLCLAFSYAAWRLENQGVIHPDDLDIIEAYTALPRYTGSIHDDGVDFETPRARLRLALAQPLDKTNTPRDPEWTEN